MNALPILIVDSRPRAYGELIARLRARGHPVKVAADPNAGIAALEEDKPRLVLLGLDGSDIDPLAFIERARELPGVNRVPAITISGHEESGFAVQALERGAVDHLRRSQDVEEMVARIDAALRSKARLDAVHDRNADLIRAARQDPLTTLFNRYSLEEVLGHQSLAAARYKRPFSVIVADVDRFKEINDGFGHQVGDLVLCAVADSFKERVRASDILGRWGGDEFMFVLPETPGEGAANLAESLRAGLHTEKVWHDQKPIHFTASFGWSSVEGGDPFSIFERADQALYAAKRAGRDTVCGPIELAAAPAA